MKIVIREWQQPLLVDEVLQGRSPSKYVADLISADLNLDKNTKLQGGDNVSKCNSRKGGRQ